ncbi:hypothetical protein CDO52_00975 [Nocardiopsis gilva YIM 90087]|uniref:Uncharacterized protein n=1 Tax=Nocardiopsis gilva YIM 90087 TaxID=1235441 RepID=A0A223S093_9ACTN|nr:hypothetical protein [Nocardiopsis gilva]ASU81552.1 hypothetical protein CDO52_00975 [Nocardiopsis gilva YIM 90087]
MRAKTPDPAPLAVRRSVTRLAEVWPLGTEVTHIETGCRGVVAFDDAAGVPCLSTGGDTAWCLVPSQIAGTWRPGEGNSRKPGHGSAVFVEFTHPEYGTWRAWVRTDFLLRRVSPGPDPRPGTERTRRQARARRR